MAFCVDGIFPGQFDSGIAGGVSDAGRGRLFLRTRVCAPHLPRCQSLISEFALAPTMNDGYCSRPRLSVFVW